MPLLIKVITGLFLSSDARMGNILHQDIVAVPSVNSQDYVYPGERVILLYSEVEGCGNVIMYNNEIVPYVANTFDYNVQSSLSSQSSGSKCFRYFVPPRTSDTDYFGGQLTMWQIKMVHYFLKYHPHIWKMHGVPETFDIEMFLRNAMSVVGEFHIVSKLRFCCRVSFIYLFLDVEISSAKHLASLYPLIFRPVRPHGHQRKGQSYSSSASTVPPTVDGF